MRDEGEDVVKRGEVEVVSTGCSGESNGNLPWERCLAVIFERVALALPLLALKEETGWSNREMDRQGSIGYGRVGRLLALLEDDAARTGLEPGG